MRLGTAVAMLGARPYQNADSLLPLPVALVTTTLTYEPSGPAGVVADSCVGDSTTTLVAGRPKTVTLVWFATKFVPVTVIRVPPSGGPPTGLTPVTVGAATVPT